MYRLTVEGGETYVVMMRNIFTARMKIHKKYDLKVSKLFKTFKLFLMNESISDLKGTNFLL